jgi:hypothetical protein
MESTRLQVYAPDVENKLSPIHLLPCKIDYDGLAKVDSYFMVDQLSIREPEADPKVLVAAFRGRRLLGESVPLPPGSGGYVVSENFDYDDLENKVGDEEDTFENLNAGQGKRFFQVEGRFDAITHWHQDTMPPRVDGLVPRVMNYIKLARVLHGPMDELESH